MRSSLHDGRDYISPFITTSESKNRIVVTPWSPESCLYEWWDVDTGWASTVWTTRLVVYVPFVVNEPIRVSSFFWDNGVSTVNGFSDLGVYSFEGTRLINTGPVQNVVKGTSTTNYPQVAPVPDTLLTNGYYWLAYGCDTSFTTINRANAAFQFLDAMGIKQQASGWQVAGVNYVQGHVQGSGDVLEDDPFLEGDMMEATQSAGGLPLTATFQAPSVGIVPIFGLVGTGMRVR